MRFLLVFLVCFTLPALACINESEEYHKKHLRPTDTYGDGLFTFSDNLVLLRSSKNALIADTAFLKLKYEETDSVKYLSDYAAALIYAGQTHKAKEIYLTIEAVYPGLYTTASNLGTAYELLGKVDSALHWIRKGYEINPDSHDGTEWVHITLLEFKLSGDTNTLGMFGLDFGTEPQPIRWDNSDQYASADLAHQLTERLFFIDAPNPILAQMYFDMGSHLLEQGYAAQSIHFLRKAKEYGFVHPELLENRIDYAINELEVTTAIPDFEEDLSIVHRDPRLDVMLILAASLVVVVLVVLVIVVVRTRRKKNFGK